MTWFHRILDKPSALTVYQWTLKIHLWVGLTVGLLISVLGLTGSLIVFRQEIYRSANTPLMRVAPGPSIVPLQEQANQVLRANPGGQINFIVLPRDNRDSTRFFVRFKDRTDLRDRDLYVNPYTGQILGTSPREVRWLDWIASLHRNLLAGRTGRLVDGIIAIFFLTLCMTGIFAWWPGRRHWKRNLVVNGRLRGWSLALSLHKAVGFWTLLILGMFAVTGISFAWNMNKIVYWITRSSPRTMNRLVNTWKNGDGMLPIDELLRRAGDAIPQGKAVFINFPSGRVTTVSVAIRLPSDFQREGAVNSVYLDPTTGAVLRVDLLSEAPLGQRVLACFGALHFGRFGFWSLSELPIKIAWVVMGLVPGTLFYTGFLSWWNRMCKRRWKQSTA